MIDDEDLLPCGVCGEDTDICGADLQPLPAGMLEDVVVFCPRCRRMMNELPPPAAAREGRGT